MMPLTVDASPELLDTVIGYVDDAVSEVCSEPGTLMQLELVVEEVFINVASYAYGDDRGSVTVTVNAARDSAGKTVTIIFADSGVAFDPTAKQDADISPDGLMSRVGGLGIHLVRKIMDSVSYRREDGMNVLTMKKTLNSGIPA